MSGFAQNKGLSNSVLMYKPYPDARLLLHGSNSDGVVMAA
jgi:hypothetical protein